MSPTPRGGGKGRRGRATPRKKRRGGGAARIAFAFLVVVAAAAGGLAMYFGFVPGPWAGRPSRPDRRAESDAVALSPPAGVPAGDSATAATAAPVDSAVAPVVAAASRAITQADSAVGDALYHGAGKCVGCHGAFGEGAPPLGPSLRDDAWTSGDGSVGGIERVIAGGAPAGGAYRIAMPAYAAQLSMEDVRRIAAYVYTLSHPGVAVPDSAPGAPSANESVNADVSPSASTPAARGSTTTAAPRIARPTVPPPPPRKP